MAARIEVKVVYRESLLEICIRDNGRGINSEILRNGRRLGHWGTFGMRERAERIGARLSIESAPGTGTMVALTLPIIHESEVRLP
jgi:signal transduction histidine kinase